jgi:predicted hotdog family 3-hydroxylacyl-ACP dehydratase
MITVNTPIVNSDSILQYIPQRPPMVLINRIYNCDEESIITGFDIVDEHFLTQNGVLTESGIIENMAQTAASMAGYEAVVKNTQPKVGFIANIKDLVIHQLPKSGFELLTEVKAKTQVMNVSIIEANSYCNNQKIATCEMKIFIQEND